MVKSSSIYLLNQTYNPVENHGTDCRYFESSNSEYLIQTVAFTSAQNESAFSLTAHINDDVIQQINV